MPTRPKGSKRPAYVYRQCMSLSCGLLLVRLKEAFLTMAKPPAAKALEGSGRFASPMVFADPGTTCPFSVI